MTGKRSVHDKMLAALMKRKRAYERYFKSTEGQSIEGTASNQANTAYMNLIKLICAITDKSPDAQEAAQTSQTELSAQPDTRAEIERVLLEEYGITRSAR